MKYAIVISACAVTALYAIFVGPLKLIAACVLIVAVPIYGWFFSMIFDTRRFRHRASVYYHGPGLEIFVKYSVYVFGNYNADIYADDCHIATVYRGNEIGLTVPDGTRNISVLLCNRDDCNCGTFAVDNLVGNHMYISDGRARESLLTVAFGESFDTDIEYEKENYRKACLEGKSTGYTFLFTGTVSLSMLVLKSLLLRFRAHDRPLDNMNTVSKTYSFYGLLCVAIGLLYAYYISGPSRLLPFGFGASLLYCGFKVRKLDDGDIKRSGYTLISALSPGIVHVFKIFPEDRRPISLLIGIGLIIGFFGGFMLAGLVILNDSLNLFHGVNLFPFFVAAAVSIMGSSDVSITLVNGYCDQIQLPYGDGRFENHHADPKKDAIKAAIVYAVISIILLVVLIHFMGLTTADASV